jgi:hypothetical protein
LLQKSFYSSIALSVYLFLSISLKTVPAGYCQANTRLSNNIPEPFFGGWQIYKVLSVGNHDAKHAHLNKLALGKSIILFRNRIVTDHRLTWLGWICASPKYKLEIGPKQTNNGLGAATLYKKGDLGFYKLPNKNPSVHLIAYCGKDIRFVLEQAPNNNLVNYFDGWLFFLRKDSHKPNH